MFENTLDVRSVQNNSEITNPVHRIKCGVATAVTAQAQRDGYNVSLYAVRRWAAQGLLKVVLCGRKQLINYQSLIDHLEGTMRGTPYTLC